MNNDNFIMIQSEWLDLSMSLSPKPEPRGCLCCTATWWCRHRGSKTPSFPFLWSPSLGGALFLAAEMLIGRYKLESALLRARWSWPPSYPALLRVSHCGVGCKAEPLPEGWAGEHPTSRGDILLTPPVLTTGPGYTGKGYRTPVWYWKGKGKMHCISFGVTVLLSRWVVALLHAVSFQCCLSCAGNANILLLCQRQIGYSIQQLCWYILTKETPTDVSIK